MMNLTKAKMSNGIIHFVCSLFCVHSQAAVDLLICVFADRILGLETARFVYICMYVYVLPENRTLGLETARFVASVACLAAELATAPASPTDPTH